MFTRIIRICGVLILVAMATPVQARTWYVEKDGSGEFATIHNAMIACSAGDTIMIGPGRYDDFHPFTAPAWTTEAIVGVTKDNLTFIGSGNTSTIIGPTEMYLTGSNPEPMAVVSVDNISASFRDIGIENAYNGLYWAQGGIEVAGCRFDGYREGIYLTNEGGARVSGTNFYSAMPLPDAIVTFSPCGALVVDDCYFSGSYTNEIGVSVNGTEGVSIQNCSFALRNAVTFSGSSGIVFSCTTLEETAQAVWATSGSQVTLTNNQLHGNYAALYVDSNSQVTGTNNIFTGGQQVATIYVSSESTVQLHDNHILKSSDLAVKLQWFFNAQVSQDLAGNFWGTTDTDSIGLWIEDVNDDPAIHSVAVFLPIADGPVPTETRSWGDVKSLYR